MPGGFLVIYMLKLRFSFFLSFLWPLVNLKILVMKKTFLFFATLFICFSYANGAIVIQKQGGGTDGYDKVNEQHENSGNSLLQCKDSGNDPCKFTIQPSGGVHYA